MNQNMIGFTREYYTLQNADGHDLVIAQGLNSFLTESMAREVAQVVCSQLRDMVLVCKHVDIVVGAYNATVAVEEVDDTSALVPDVAP